MDYHDLAVGKPFNPSDTNYTEGSRTLVAGRHVLFAMFRGNPDADAIEAVRRGRCEFFLWARESQIVVCLHCRSSRGEIWADAPFDVRHLLGEVDVPAPRRPSPGEPIIGEAIIALVDAADGLVEAIRAVSLSEHFMRSLSEAIHRQSLIPLDEGAEESAMRELYSRHPTFESLARACVVRCEGWA